MENQKHFLNNIAISIIMCVHLWLIHALLHSAIIIYVDIGLIGRLLYFCFQCIALMFTITVSIMLIFSCVVFYFTTYIILYTSIFHSFSLNSNIIYDLHALCHRSIVAYSILLRCIVSRFVRYLLSPNIPTLA